MRHATDNQWQSSNVFHFDASQSIYLACQTDGEAEGVVESIKKIDGPEIALDSVRVIDFGDQDQNQQVLLQPLNIKGAMSISGTYQCDVSSLDKKTGYSRHVEIIMHGRMSYKYAHTHTHTQTYRVHQLGMELVVISFLHTTHTYTYRVHQLDMELVLITFLSTLCIEKFCPTHQDIPNGSIKMNGYVPGSCYTVMCDNGYLLRGSFARQCSDEGMWTGVEPVCGKLSVDENVVSSGWFTQYTVVWLFICTFKTMYMQHNTT